MFNFSSLVRQAIAPKSVAKVGVEGSNPFARSKFPMSQAAH
jgi:hypothetical protein